MMEAILIGETTNLEKLWTEHFRRSGTYHALVISGLHVTVLAASLICSYCASASSPKQPDC